MTAPALAVDILLQAPAWEQQADADATIRRALAAAADSVAHPAAAQAVVVLASDAAVQQLNRDWRGRDVPTNVLSFPAAAMPAATGEPPMLGDIVLAYETLVREAEAEGKPFAHHLAHLAVHGFLHLLGYDHLTEAEAAVMEDAERKILRRLQIPDPYAAAPGDRRAINPA